MKDIYEIKDGNDTIECHYTLEGRVVDEDTNYDVIEFELDKVIVNGVDCTQYALRLDELKPYTKDDERYVLDGGIVPECVGLLVAYDYSFSRLEELTYEYLQQIV